MEGEEFSAVVDIDRTSKGWSCVSVTKEAKSTPGRVTSKRASRC
jgi:hypothetical protein